VFIQNSTALKGFGSSDTDVVWSWFCSPTAEFSPALGSFL